MHRWYPKQSLVMTEFGAEATLRLDRSKKKGSYEFQADYANKVMDVVARNPFMDGALYWTVARVRREARPGSAASTRRSTRKPDARSTTRR